MVINAKYVKNRDIKDKKGSPKEQQPITATDQCPVKESTLQKMQ